MPLERSKRQLNEPQAAPLEELQARYFAKKLAEGTDPKDSPEGQSVSRAEPSAKPKQKWHELKPSAQAGIRCNEPDFHRFLGSHATTIADALRRRLGIISRKQLDDDEGRALRWAALDDEYIHWMRQQ